MKSLLVDLGVEKRFSGNVDREGAIWRRGKGDDVKQTRRIAACGCLLWWLWRKGSGENPTNSQEERRREERALSREVDRTSH